MASLTALQIYPAIQRASSRAESLYLCYPTRAFNNFFRPRIPGLCFSSRHRRRSSAIYVSSKKTNKNKVTHKNVEEDEDAFEALFSQLEEDLKNDELFGEEDEDDDISDEELAKLEQELAEALENDEIVVSLDFATHEEVKNEDDNIAEDHEEVKNEDDNIADDGGVYEVDDDNEEEERPVNLKNWQLRRLAYALKDGRRKTRIKNLAAELFLDRAVVLRLLRDPPPNLVMLSATLPDKPVPTISDPVEKVKTVPLVTKALAANPQVKAKVPVHAMRSNWSAEKRLKKVQLRTLEQVFARTKRPTNTMISSIVHVTNLPRKRVVKWFEDKRAEDGVPELRLPYQGSGDKPTLAS